MSVTERDEEEGKCEKEEKKKKFSILFSVSSLFLLLLVVVLLLLVPHSWEERDGPTERTLTEAEGSEAVLAPRSWWEV